MALCQTVVVAPLFSDALAMTATGTNPRIRGMPSADEPMRLFRRDAVVTSNGHASSGHVSNGHAPSGQTATLDAAMANPPVTEEPPFGLDDFPELSLGTPLWSELISKLVNFDMIVSHLRDTLLILSGRGCRAAALVADGEIVKAVWVTAWGGLVGEEAAQAMLRSSKGTITAHRLDDPSVATALLLLWPGAQVEASPPVVEDVPEAVMGAPELVDEAPEPDNEASAVTDDPEQAPVNAAPEYADEAAPSTAQGEAPDITDDSESDISAEDTRASGEPDTEPAAVYLTPDPAVFSIASLSPDLSPDPTEMELVEARAATEFVPPRIDVDIDSLRGELTEIAVRWLGADDSSAVAGAIAATRPGVDDFVSTIAAIAAMDIPGHESAIVRAMAREMNYRASEVLCGV